MFLVLSLSFSSCFDAPSFGTTPVIEFEKIEFVELGDFSDPDSLNLYIRFRDGDGDLGLNADQMYDPYNSTNFFVGNSGELTPVTAGLYYINFKYKSNGRTPRDPSYVIDPKTSTGKLVSFADQAIYDLPPFQSPYSTCTAYDSAYVQDTIFVSFDNRGIINPTQVIDTLIDQNGLDVGYALLQTWYVQPNPSHYNITVKFLVKQNDATFKEYDFVKEFCQTYDGRFPTLSEDNSPLEGTLLYAMIGSGFQAIFSVKTLKLEIQIKDRALNTSEVISTPEFTLSGIRK